MKILIFMFLFTSVITAQNKITIDERTNRNMAVGYCNRTIFEDSSFVNWFNEEYSNYEIKNIDDVSDKLADINVTIVLGTWCGDSRREVPRFYKILDSLNFPDDRIKLLFVDRKKQGIENETEGLNIEYVPTFIFYRDEKEIGRIIETPDESLEEDLISIAE
ncbi:MAG: thioredoxin family protein [Bacteroidetes bacterium]|nr:thioredoxin family protein [Bacteroidota bacterium]